MLAGAGQVAESRARMLNEIKKKIELKIDVYYSACLEFSTMLIGMTRWDIFVYFHNFFLFRSSKASLHLSVQK